MKIVINKCFGGYSISPEACLWLFERGFDAKGFKTPIGEYWKDLEKVDGMGGFPKALATWQDYLAKKPEGRTMFITVFTPDEKFVLDQQPEAREHPLLVECVQVLGDKANGGLARLRIVEIPDGIKYQIDEYDGQESVHEEHSSWG